VRTPYTANVIVVYHPRKTKPSVGICKWIKTIITENISCIKEPASHYYIITPVRFLGFKTVSNKYTLFYTLSYHRHYGLLSSSIFPLQITCWSGNIETKLHLTKYGQLQTTYAYEKTNSDMTELKRITCDDDKVNLHLTVTKEVVKIT
jgi:hypothetical protein